MLNVTNMMEYVKPELMIVAVVLYLVGIGLKKAQYFADKHIPLVLGFIGILLALLWVSATSSFSCWQNLLMALFTAIVQGVLVAAASVYANQIYKQSTK